MAKFVLKHPKISIAGYDLEDHASSLTIETTYDEVEFTAFCSDFREFGQGLGDCTWTVDFFQDFDTNKVDQVLWPVSQSGNSFNIRATPGMGTTNALRGSARTDNPLYNMTARCFSYSPIAGAVGDASTTSVTFRNASSNGLTRVTGGSTV